MSRAVGVVAAWWLVLASATDLPAQRAQAYLDRGVEAYRALDYPAAAGLLKLSLAEQGPERLADSLRAGAYVYLGAAELFRGNRDAATAAFRAAVLLDPRHRADRLIFPPPVTDAYQAAREKIVVVRIDSPADTTIVPGRDKYRVRLFSSGAQTVRVDLESDDGRPIQKLYSGPIGDSLDLAWDGLDQGRPLNGSARIRAVANRSGMPAFSVQRNLVTRLIVSDTVPWPAPLSASQFVSEHRPAGPALRTLGIGLAAGLATALLPKVIAADQGGQSTRFVVGGAIGVATAIGFLTRRPGSVMPESARANQALRDRWKRQADSVHALNERARANLRLEIQAAEVVADRTPP